MRLLCIAAESNRKGYVLINGRPPSAGELSKVIGATVSEVQMLLDELDHNGVYSKTRHGIIYCRRMIKQVKKRTASAKGGKIGGRVTHEKQKGIFSTQGPTKDTTQAGAQHPMVNPSPIPLPSKKETVVPLAKANGCGHAAAPPPRPKRQPKPPKPDEWKEVYERGREVIGQSAGGQISLLRKLYNQKPHKVMAAIEDAAEHRVPEEWIARLLWNAKDDGRLSGEYIGGVPP